MSKRVVLVERDGLLEIGLRLVEIAELRVRMTAVVEDVWIVRCALRCDVVVGERLLLVALSRIGPGAAVIGIFELGVALQRLTVIGDSQVVFAELGLGVAAIVIGIRLFRIEPDRLVVVGDGLLVIALVLVVVTAICTGDSEIDLGLLAARDNGAAAGEASVRVLGSAVVPIFIGLCVRRR